MCYVSEKKDFSTLRIKNDLPNLATLYIRDMKVGMKKTHFVFLFSVEET